MDSRSIHRSSSANKKMAKRLSETNSLQQSQSHQYQVQIKSPKHVKRNESKSNLVDIITNKRAMQMSLSPRKNIKSNLDQEEQSEKVDSVGPSNGSTIYDQAVSRFQCIATITEEENKNLKDQNIFLLDKLRRMQQRQSKVRKLYEKAKKYKALWQEAQMQIQVLKDQCQIYREQADQMKKIILNDVNRLKQKVNQVNLNQSKDNQMDHNQEVTASTNKKSQIKSQTSTESSLNRYLKPSISKG